MHGYGCIANRCSKCDIQCKNCSSTSTAQCTECWATSVDYNKSSISAGSCVIDHIDFTKISDPITLQVPPAVQWRATISFWTFVHDVTKVNTSVINFIFKDFMSVSISRDSTTNTSLNFYCTPIEYLYSIQGKSTFSTLTTHLDTTLKAPYLKDTIALASSKWIYTQCAFSFDKNIYYLNSIAEAALPVSQQYSTLNNFTWLQKKFYRTADKVNFIIEGHSAITTTEVYFKNINIFREYMPQNWASSNFKYL